MLLAVLFFVTALIYACVGFGGGSTYSALLILHGTDYSALPFIALICNVIVVSGGVWHFARAGHIQVKQILPWIYLSVPAAWLGGFMNVPELFFIGILGGALFLSGIRMLWPEQKKVSPILGQFDTVEKSKAPPLVIGAALGFLAGIIGIGGGIFLAPILHLLRWSDSKNIAGICSLFILVNSIAGLLGQSMKIGGVGALPIIESYWYIFPTVLIGGQIGSWLGSSRINVKYVKILTAVLILYVSIRLLWRVGTAL